MCFGSAKLYYQVARRFPVADFAQSCKNPALEFCSTKHRAGQSATGQVAAALCVIQEPRTRVFHFVANTVRGKLHVGHRGALKE